MDDLTEDAAGLIDLTGVSLEELQSRTDSPFAHCLRRLISENDDPDALTVVAFQSAA
jgi:hypothetical protein